jgi:uncharacterized membrane protein
MATVESGGSRLSGQTRMCVAERTLVWGSENCCSVGRSYDRTLQSCKEYWSTALNAAR